jgi:predicted cobalt transporter CbtA
MAFEIHDLSVVEGSQLQNQDKVVLAVQYGVANGSAGTGVAVTVAVSFLNSELPANYAVHVTPSQPCWVSVTSKTANGFNVVLTPQSTLSIAAGTFDVIVVG